MIMVLIFQVAIAKTQTNMKCAPEQVVWVGARENAEMESSEEKLAMHLCLSYIGPPTIITSAGVCSTSMRQN